VLVGAGVSDGCGVGDGEGVGGGKAVSVATGAGVSVAGSVGCGVALGTSVSAGGGVGWGVPDGWSAANTTVMRASGVLALAPALDCASELAGCDTPGTTKWPPLREAASRMKTPTNTTHASAITAEMGWISNPVPRRFDCFVLGLPCAVPVDISNDFIIASRCFRAAAAAWGVMAGVADLGFGLVASAPGAGDGVLTVGRGCAVPAAPTGFDACFVVGLDASGTPSARRPFVVPPG